MALRGSSGRFKLKLSRPLLIIMGALVLLLLIIVVLSFTVLKKGGQPTGSKAAGVGPAGGKAEPTAIAAASTPYPGATEIATAIPVQPTAPQPAAQPTSPQSAEKTPIPPPTRVVAAAPSVTPLPSGGQLPGTSGGGLFWLIPVGVLLLIAVLWWRWRRARATG